MIFDLTDFLAWRRTRTMVKQILAIKELFPVMLLPGCNKSFFYI